MSEYASPEMFKQNDNTYPEDAPEQLEQKEEKFISINEVLAYGLGADVAHIHVMPADNKSPREKYVLFVEGLKNLADVVRDNEDIKRVIGTSWIIAEHAPMIEKLGFTVTGAIPEDLRDVHFKDEERDIWGAEMSREDFLNTYG